MTYCDNRFMMYISQIIMLYTLNLYSALCQLYSIKLEEKKINNKTKKKKKKKVEDQEFP